MASFDLHVLGTPPAFILSQDQTLMFKLFLLGRSFFLLALFSAGALLLLGRCPLRSSVPGNQGSMFTVRDVSRFPFRRLRACVPSAPRSGVENFVRIFRVVLLFSCQGVADIFRASACFIISRLELFVNSFFYIFSSYLQHVKM